MTIVIVNPFSGNGAAVKALPDIEALLKERKISYEVKTTSAPGDGLRYAEAAARSGADMVIAAGGDGTLGEVARGVAGSAAVLLFAPCGTGNDFVKTLRLPVHPIEALRNQLDAQVRRLDYAYVNDTAFLNVCGTGFDVDVLRKLSAYREKYKGMKAYLFALKDALKNYKPLNCEISIDGGNFERRSLAILSVGNGKFFGGGMKAVPMGVPNDGYLNVVMVNAVRRAFIPFLLPLFIFGAHTKLPIAKTLPCKRLTVRSGGMTMQLDGELFAMSEANIRIVENSVNARY